MADAADRDVDWLLPAMRKAERSAYEGGLCSDALLRDLARAARRRPTWVRGRRIAVGSQAGTHGPSRCHTSGRGGWRGRPTVRGR